ARYSAEKVLRMTPQIRFTHPHVFVLPLLRSTPRTTAVFPQTHIQSHFGLVEFGTPFEWYSSTVREPNVSPDISMSLRRLRAVGFATSFSFPLLAFYDPIVHPSPLVHLRLNLPRIAPRSNPRDKPLRLHLPLRPQVHVAGRKYARLQPVVAPRLLLVNLLPLLKLTGVDLALTLPDAAVRYSPSQEEPEAAARTACQFFARSSAARFDIPFRSRISSNSRSSAAPLFFARASASFSSNR